MKKLVGLYTGPEMLIERRRKLACAITADGTIDPGEGELDPVVMVPHTSDASMSTPT